MDESNFSRLPVLAVVVPCYNEELVVKETAHLLTLVLQRLIGNYKINDKSFIYFVDDGSKDTTWSLIMDLHKGNHSMIKGLTLSKNMGHQKALIAGMTSVYEHGADCIITIDADLQDDVRVIQTFVDRFREGYDIVYGVRENRSVDSFNKRVTANLFYRLMLSMGVEIVDNHADYRLLSRRAMEAFQSFREVNLFLRGMIPLLGFASTTVYYTRQERFAGESKYPLKKMLSFALDGITSFSTMPLRIITYTGFLVFILSFLMSIYIFLQSLIVGGNVPGWASTVLPVYVLGGVQILSIGVIGEYLGKTYSEVKDRPRFIKDKEVF